MAHIAVETRRLARAAAIFVIFFLIAGRFEMETQMSDFDVEGFVAQMERMGLKMTAVRLDAVEHTDQIEDLWTSQIGDNPARMDQLAAHLYLTVPWVTTNRISSALRKVK
jgi:acetyl-CoA acetyltransferase